MKIDCYGFKEGTSAYFNRYLSPVDIVEADGYIYMRFSTTPECTIHRIDNTTEGSTSVRYTYGKWEDRATLTYNTDINSALQLN